MGGVVSLFREAGYQEGNNGCRCGTLSATVWQSDDQFNAGLFQFHLFVATHGGTEDIRSKANKDLKAWIMEQEKLRKSTPDPTDMRIKVLDLIKFPW